MSRLGRRRNLKTNSAARVKSSAAAALEAPLLQAVCRYEYFISSLLKKEFSEEGENILFLRKEENGIFFHLDNSRIRASFSSCSHHGILPS